MVWEMVNDAGDLVAHFWGGVNGGFLLGPGQQLARLRPSISLLAMGICSKRGGSATICLAIVEPPVRFGLVRSVLVRVSPTRTVFC